MRAFHHPDQAEHRPEFFMVRGERILAADQPERIVRLCKGLDEVGVVAEPPPDFGTEPLAAVHTERYLDFLANAHREWSDYDGPHSEEVVANIHPARIPAGYPTGIVGRAGWHTADTSCPIGPDTWRSARASVNSALAAAEAVAVSSETGSADLQDRLAYALCRPSGHHAFADMAGGFCYLNNTAIAAQWLRARGHSVAVLDVDVHHGNGTQDIFYDRDDVLTVSIHRDPTDYYPFFWGYSDQVGEGPGEGFNLNLPLAAGSGDVEFLAALEQAAGRVTAFGPDALVVALGLDASELDPLQGLKVTTNGFERIGKAIGQLGLPTILVQEGGYLSDVLGHNLAAFLTGVLSEA